MLGGMLKYFSGYGSARRAPRVEYWVPGASRPSVAIDFTTDPPSLDVDPAVDLTEAAKDFWEGFAEVMEIRRLPWRDASD